MRAIVTGMIATYPIGGVVWDYGQYALGLERMGWEVYYLEDTGWMTYDPHKREYGEDPSYGVHFLGESLRFLSPTLGERWHFRAMDGSSYGIAAGVFEELVAGADVLINVSGGTLLRDATMACRRKLLIDTDPGWNHFRNYPRLDKNPSWGGGRGYRAHDRFFTYALRIGSPECNLPDLGLQWHTTRPPVVPDSWQAEPPATTWTTVLTWKNLREAIVHDGVRYGTKEMEFEKVEILPSVVEVPLELAVGGIDSTTRLEESGAVGDPRPRWQELGWKVRDAQRVSDTPEHYRQYIQRSRAEFSVAKNVYVATGSGWFSCRSVCYLAAGRPVVVQDTGFSKVIPTGEGVLAFSNLGGAAAGVRAVESHYERHCAAALHLAREEFAADKVLRKMLEDADL